MSDDAFEVRGTPSVDLVSLAPGRMIGRYEVVSVLGQGGFGITYRARDGQLGREVAIKEYLPLALAVRQDGTTVLPRSTAAMDDFTWGRDRFVAEGRTLASLQDAPGIVRVFDFLEANGTAYIVMQLLHGETLEQRIARAGNLQPADLDRILWPLLDGLERVHGTGFLHRDIKPANILLDAVGNPTLIDFGASRVAMAGRSTALTAVFTPGYAAAEQMSSAPQGPWTDIYGLSATLYHAIAGRVPPSAFDRMLDDTCEPLARMALPGFARALLSGLDAGLALRAGDRPQSIDGWRRMLGRTATSDGEATVVLRRSSQPSPRARPRRIGLAVGLTAGLILVMGGGYYAMIDDKRPAAPAPVSAADKAAEDGQSAAQAQRLKDQEELAKLRADNEQRQKAEQAAAQRRQIEDETRLKIEAEFAEKKRIESEALQKAEADALARREGEEAVRKTAEAAENALRLTLPDRQHVQVALSALGYATGTTDGSLGNRTRESLAAWQKSHNDPATGYLTGAQNQALLREAAPAIARFRDEQKKAEDARRKADEDKAKAEAAARAVPAAPAAAPAPPPRASAGTAAGPRSGPDGQWSGVYKCTPSRGAGEFTLRLQLTLSGGSGTWTRPGSGPGTTANQSITVKVAGAQVAVSRLYVPTNQAGAGVQTATLAARFEDNSITGTGPEQNSGGRTCDIALTRAQ